MKPVDQQLLRLLAANRELAPDVRFGQLLAHLEFLGEVRAGSCLAEIDDGQLLTVLEGHREELAARVDEAAGVRMPTAG